MEVGNYNWGEVVKYKSIFDVVQGINNKPALNWWVPHVMKKQDHIIYAIKQINSHYLKRTRTFGVVCTKTVEEAYAIENNNGNYYWNDSISK